jgi:hypothetical protein
MPRGVKAADVDAISPEEREKRRAQRKADQERRDRVGMLRNAERSVARARIALENGDASEHDAWLDVATTTLTSYKATSRVSTSGASLAGVNGTRAD